MKRAKPIQIGKNGITENFMNSLKNLLKTHDWVKISVLKNLTRDKEKIKKYAEEMVEILGKNYVHRVIGFTIVLRKMRKNVR